MSSLLSGIIRPHRMHQMRTIATDILVAWCVCLLVCLSVCQSVTRLHLVKTVEQLDIMFGPGTLGPKEHCTGGGPASPMARGRGVRKMLHCCTLYCITLLFRLIRIRQLAPHSMRHRYVILATCYLFSTVCEIIFHRMLLRNLVY